MKKNIFSSKSARNHDCMSLIRKSFWFTIRKLRSIWKSKIFESVHAKSLKLIFLLNALILLRLQIQNQRKILLWMICITIWFILNFPTFSHEFSDNCEVERIQKIVCWGSFWRLKPWLRFFSKFELFVFLRNKIWDQPI